MINNVKPVHSSSLMITVGYLLMFLEIENKCTGTCTYIWTEPFLAHVVENVVN